MFILVSFPCIVFKNPKIHPEKTRLPTSSFSQIIFSILQPYRCVSSWINALFFFVFYHRWGEERKLDGSNRKYWVSATQDDSKCISSVNKFTISCFSTIHLTRSARGFHLDPCFSILVTLSHVDFNSQKPQLAQAMLRILGVEGHTSGNYYTFEKKMAYYPNWIPLVTRTYP